MLKTQRFKSVYAGWCHSVDHFSKQKYRVASNQHILQRLFEAVVLCGKQGIALRGHREKENQNLDESGQPSPNRGNFIAIVKAFAKQNDILRNHFFKGQRNAQYISPRIQNEIIGAIAEFVREKIREVLKENVNFCIVTDEVTDDHANKEVLLECLRFLQNRWKKVVYLSSALFGLNLQSFSLKISNIFS